MSINQFNLLSLNRRNPRKKMKLSMFIIIRKAADIIMLTAYAHL